MTRLVNITGVIAMSVLFLPGLVRGDDKDVIEYREHIMNTLNEQAAALGLILATTIPDDNAAAHLEALALTARTALRAFEANVPGGEAKPEIWSNWPDFSKRMNEFVQNMSEATKTAKEKGNDAALSDILDKLTCKGCHEIYRNEKKK
jgi:cytochrome c556